MNAPASLHKDRPDNLVDTRLAVPGMRCAGCIAKVERGLAGVGGVKHARVNFSARRVAVQHEPWLDEDGLAEALLELGFESQPVADDLLVSGDDKEARQLLRALAVAGFGMMNIMLLSVSVWSGADGVTRDMFHWLSALIALPVVAYAGRPFFSSAITALRHGRTNMDVPISIGVLLATALSLYETATGGEHAYFDGAVMLLFFLLAGRALDATMRNRTRAGIGALLSRMGRGAHVFQPDGATRRVAADELVPGMLMQVAAGEALAADGVVEGGQGLIDNSMLTGESAPEHVQPGAQIHAGVTNLLNPLQVRVTATGDDRTMAEIARLMEDAGQSRGRYVRIADRASRLYAPVVHALALLAFMGWMLAGAGWHQSLVVAIAVLIITCPCAMGLAVPAAQVTAAGALLRRGVMVKDGSALERLSEVDLALFDKTGTLTMGEPHPDLSELNAEERSIALALAQTSRHPLSRGLVKTLQAEQVKPANIDKISEQAGVGVSGRYQGMNVALCRPEGQEVAGLASILAIGTKEKLITFSDPLRPDIGETMAGLDAIGITSQIVSGDRQEAVSKLAGQFDIVGEGDVSPARKLQILERFKTAGYRPLMVGDGLNDGPALAAAHASLAPGTASDVSQQAADAVFVSERLGSVLEAVTTAQRTMFIVRQNFAFAIGYNVLAVPLALTGLVTPLIAAIAMSASSIVVVANSLRLARVK